MKKRLREKQFKKERQSTVYLLSLLLNDEINEDNYDKKQTSIEGTTKNFYKKLKINHWGQSPKKIKLW